MVETVGKIIEEECTKADLSLDRSKATELKCSKRKKREPAQVTTLGAIISEHCTLRAHIEHRTALQKQPYRPLTG